MRQTEDRHPNRQRVISMLGILFILAIGTRLVMVQGLASNIYTHQAETQHVKRTPLSARRGQILDRNQRVLATTLQSRSFFVNNISDADTFKAITVAFSRQVGEPERHVMSRIGEGRSFVWLARQLVGGPDTDALPNGVGHVVEMTRHYPMGQVAGQLVGYTNVDNVGIEGIELSFDPLLRGQPGEIASRVDALGRPIGDFGIVRRMPEHGEDLVLTIDADYQSIAEEELEWAVAHFRAESGIAIVTDPATGEILAMANVPLYDPNHFHRYGPSVRRNRAVTDVFEPGSTFKIVAVAGALEEGLYVPEDSVFCEHGRLEVDGGFIRDTHAEGWLSVGGVIEKSSNVGTIKIARELGVAGLFRYVRLFGFGSTTGGGLPGEVAGIVRHPSSWSGRSLETITIGQEIGTTALQVATAYGVIANGGVLLAPRFYRYGRVEERRFLEASTDTIRRVISAETAAIMRDFLEGTVRRGTGTRAAIPGYRVAGKTGTAQRSYEGKPGYDPDRYLSSFVGYLPAEAPELLCLVAIDSPLEEHLGSQVAAPVFAKIMQRILSRRGTTVRHRAQIAAVEIADTQPIWLAPRVPDSPPVVRSIPVTDGGALNMPNVVGVPMRRAVSSLTAVGFRVKAVGSGRVVRQYPPEGVAVRPGTIARVTCRRPTLKIE